MTIIMMITLMLAPNLATARPDPQSPGLNRHPAAAPDIAAARHGSPLIPITARPAVARNHRHFPTWLLPPELTTADLTRRRLPIRTRPESP